MFVRRYTTYPSDATLRETSHIGIIEQTPAGAAVGVGRGYPLVVGQVTNDIGAPNASKLFTSPAEMRRYFGEPSPYIGSAADGYDGNVAAQVEGVGDNKSRMFPLVVIPVDAEAGEVTFSRPAPGTASVVGNAQTYRLVSGDTLTLKVDGGAPQTATWDAVAAENDGAAGAFAGAVGGTLIYRTVTGGPARSATYGGAVAAGIAAALVELNTILIGCHAENNGGQVRLVSDVEGTSSEMEIVTGSTAALLTELGLSVGTCSNSGAVAGSDVADIDAVTAAELETIVEADTTAEVSVSGGVPTLSTPTSGAGGSIEVTGGDANDAFGFATGVVTGGTDTAPAGIIYAGTRVRDATAGKTWLTLEDLSFAADALSGTVRVQHANGTSGTSSAGNIATILDTPAFDTTFVVGNGADVIAWSSAGSQADAYSDAFDVAKDANDAWAKYATVFLSAAHPNDGTAQSSCKSAAVSRSRTGRGAIACVSPGIGKTRSNVSTGHTYSVDNAASGGRDERRWYFWPGIRKRTDISGSQAIVDFTSDFTWGNLLARQEPWESIGQPRAEYTDHVIGVESGVAAIEYDDYVALKTAGICAPNMDPDGVCIQDAVTSSTTSGETDTVRRQMADYIGDTLAKHRQPYKDAPMRPSLMDDIIAIDNAFLDGLKSVEDPDRQAIWDYANEDVTTASDRRAGIGRSSCTVDLLGNASSFAIELAAGAGIIELDESAI